jgi:hypothetical protein
MPLLSKCALSESLCFDTKQINLIKVDVLHVVQIVEGSRRMRDVPCDQVEDHAKGVECLIEI